MTWISWLPKGGSLLLRHTDDQPPPPQHGAAAQKGGSEGGRRKETNGEQNGWKERERERCRKGYDNHFCASAPPPPPPHPNANHEMSLSVTSAAPFCLVPPLWKWNPHLNTHDDIWIHLSASTLMGGGEGTADDHFVAPKLLHKFKNISTYIYIYIYLFFFGLS